MRLTLLSVLLAVAGCLPLSTELPSESDARTFLNETVALVSTGNLDALCDLGGGSCQRILADAGEPPTDAPRVIGTRVLEPTDEGGVRSVGGIVLELCGEREGQPYYTEMLVYREGGELRATEPVYWSGFLVGEGMTVGEPQPDAAERCD